MMITAIKFKTLRPCDSCGMDPTRVIPNCEDHVMIDPNENDNGLQMIYICQSCARKLHQQLSDILGMRSEEAETVSRLDSGISSGAWVEKILSESDLVEVTLPDGTVIRVTKFGED